jgi:hypothetical protein
MIIRQNLTAVVEAVTRSWEFYLVLATQVEDGGQRSEVVCFSWLKNEARRKLADAQSHEAEVLYDQLGSRGKMGQNYYVFTVTDGKLMVTVAGSAEVWCTKIAQAIWDAHEVWYVPDSV